MIMRAYGSRAFAPRKRGSTRWKGVLAALLVGLVSGFVASTALNVRAPIELTISTPPLPETFEDGASDEIWSASNNISVRAPRPNALVASPLVVEGLERTFEQNVVVRLKDAGGRELAKVAVTGTAPDLGIHGPYRAELIFDTPRTSSGVLEVFQNSPQDGSEIDKVVVPVRFE